MSKVTPLLEKVAINYVTPGRYNNYLKLISSKFKLGPFLKEYKVDSTTDSYALIFGPTQNRLLKGKYVYLIANFSLSKRAKSGYITHFAVTDRLVTRSEIEKTGTSFKIGNIKFKPIPKDFNKFEEVMSLIIGAGAEFDSDKSDVAVAIQTDNPEQIYDINRRFEFMVQLVRLVSAKVTPGMVIVGTGGLGKTYTVMSTLHNLGLEEDRDYLHIHGAKMTPVTFYMMLHDNADRLIVLDDSDDILDSETAVNMLKSALDTTGHRTVSYISPAIENAGYPTKFAFNGQVIFISNRSKEAFAQPIRSRIYISDVSMTREEVFERMKAIIESGKLDDGNSVEQMKALNLIMDFDKKYPGKPEDLNMRTLLKVYRVICADPVGGKDLATYLLSVG